jgi:hypothetical protein
MLLNLDIKECLALVPFSKINHKSRYLNHYRWTMGIDEEQDFTVDVVNYNIRFKKLSQ